jgi:protein gp37
MSTGIKPTVPMSARQWGILALLVTCRFLCLVDRTNLSVGATAESARQVSRLEDLRRANAAVRFCSIEPLLGALPSLNLSGIDWIIVGGVFKKQTVCLLDGQEWKRYPVAESAGGARNC